jgi:hypothetical protein
MEEKNEKKESVSWLIVVMAIILSAFILLLLFTSF